MTQARLEFVVVLLCTLVVMVGCGREKALECDGGSSETKIVNNRTSSEEGVLLLEFSDGQDVPSEMEVSGDTGCNIRLEPLFEGVEDKNLERWYVARFSSEISSERVAAELAGRDDITKIQYNKIIRKAPGEVSACVEEDVPVRTKATPVQTAVFNDPGLADQWHLVNTGNTNRCKTAVEGADVSVKDAWRLTGGDPSIIVAVIDEGVMYSHPDLAENMWTNEAELNGTPGKDDDGNGYIDDIHGFNFVTNKGEITWTDKKDIGHGTHVAGTVAAVNNNGIGVSSVAGGTGNHDGVKIMSCQIWVGNQSSSEAVARAFRYAADNGASIAQCSFGDDAGAYMTDDEFKRKCSVEYAAIQYFLDKKNCNSDVVDGNIVVFSAGNNGLKISSYPGALKEVISVTSFGPGFQPAGYTNYGTGCNIAAPGGDYYVGRPGYNTKCQVYSTIPGANYEGGYGWMEGTSMATPHVSGVVALGLAYARKLGLKFTREEFISMLLTSVNSIDSYFTGTKKKDENGDMDLSWYVGKMGTGAVDAWKLLMNIEGTPSYQVAVGQSTIDLTDVLGAPAAVLKNFSVEMDDDTRSSLGVTGELTVDGSRLSVSCTKTGSGYLTIHAESEGMPVTRKISVICRPVVSGNGGWL